MTPERRAVRAGELDHPPVSSEPLVGQPGRYWSIRSLGAARQVLRARHQTAQAGFTAERIPQVGFRHRPILIADGPLHDEQRAKVARFFAPRVVGERYSELMEQVADRLLDEAERDGRAVVDDLALHYTVEVTAEVVGLTESDTGALARRLEAFFRQPPFDLRRADLGRTPRQWMRAAHRGLAPLVRFHLADVLPALRRHRREPRPDVIGHLVAEGYSTADILVECLTYGTAGMVTTREFIGMVVWHLLDHPALRDRYGLADQPERLAILSEVIRLEPVVGHLYRRVTEPIEIDHDGRTHTLSPGDVVDVCVRQTNADQAVVGPEPLHLDPDRPIAAGIDRAGLAFGDGAHKCPGQPLALLETDVFVRALLRRDPEVVSASRVGWDDLIAGYQVRGLTLRWPAMASAAAPLPLEDGRGARTRALAAMAALRRRGTRTRPEKTS